MLVKAEPVGVDAHLSLPNAISIFRDKIRKKKDQSTEHKKEKLRRTADAIMIVATLITTVTFTAAFTMPGGYYLSSDKNPGTAILSRKTSFQVFIISDALALLCSVMAIFVNFYGMLYGSERTLRSSTRVAVICTAGAIVGMLIAFGTGTYVVLAESPALAIATLFFSFLGIAYVFEMFPLLHYWEDFVTFFSRLWVSLAGSLTDVGPQVHSLEQRCSKLF
ncbi:unnamed protein product [Ilex paraguariensis]|uniref:PGG domain-containing protein n=1 Tax=Ilex paraguariensis TaxID=185542 RepID=A0ABC8TLV7_9AQUA